MGFSDEVWEKTQPIMQAIHEHPFVKALGDGSLDREVFTHYMTQDALYLADYGRAMGLLAAKALDADEVAFWANGVIGAIVAERELHSTHVDLDFGDMSPTCGAYTNFLLARAAVSPYEVGVAAILPCFWIYQVVGERLLEAAGDLDSHPYGDWIGVYSDPEFAEATAKARRIADGLAEAATAAVREQMVEAYVTAARYEWMFWDAAWRQEGWPV